MKMHLKILLPALPDLTGRNELEVEFPGEIINHLLAHLANRYCRRSQCVLLDETGRLDPAIQVLVNGEDWLERERLDTPLREGDRLALLMMAGR